MRLRRSIIALVLLAGLAPAVPAMADDPPEIAIAFLGDRFEPSDVPVPANVKVVLRVDNKSAAAMEWESSVLHREKVVPAGTSAKIFIGPLRQGTYEFFDDFHPTIRGRVVVR